MVLETNNSILINTESPFLPVTFAAQMSLVMNTHECTGESQYYKVPHAVMCMEGTDISV